MAIRILKVSKQFALLNKPWTSTGIKSFIFIRFLPNYRKLQRSNENAFKL